MDEIKCLTIVVCTLIVSITAGISYSNWLDQEVILKADDKAKTACAVAGVDRQKTAFCIEIARGGK